MELRDNWAAEQYEVQANFLAGTGIRGSITDRCELHSAPKSRIDARRDLGVTA